MLLALGILLQLLFGPNVIFLTGDVVGNLTDLIQALGDRAFIGVIALGIFAWLYVRRASG